MKPSTIINTLKVKLYLGSVRKEGVINQAIELQQEYLFAESGRNIEILCNLTERYWQQLQIDEANDLFYRRQITIQKII